MTDYSEWSISGILITNTMYSRFFCGVIFLMKVSGESWKCLIVSRIENEKGVINGISE